MKLFLFEWNRELDLPTGLVSLAPFSLRTDFFFLCITRCSMTLRVGEISLFVM